MDGTERDGDGTGLPLPCRAGHPGANLCKQPQNSRAGRESLTRGKCQTEPIMFNHGSQLNRRNLLTLELAHGKFRATQRRLFPTTVSPLITVVSHNFVRSSAACHRPYDAWSLGGQLIL
jgi:hypothetical protein